MRGWITRLNQRRAAIIDGAMVVTLGISLCSLLLAFAAFRLDSHEWRTELFGLSDDGAHYLSLCERGLRVHDVSTGKEVDRLSFKPVWAALFSSWPGTINPLHPLEEAAPSGFDVYAWTLKDEEMKRADICPQLLMSTSGRFMVAVYPAGYAVLWDREGDRHAIIGESEIVFENAWIDEARDQVNFEGIVKLKERVHFPLDHLSGEKDKLDKSVDDREVISYRLSDFSRISQKHVAAAGMRLQGNRNVRVLQEKESLDIRVMKWADFPGGAPQEIFRTSDEEIANAKNTTLRLIDDRLQLVVISKDHLELRDLQDKGKKAEAFQLESFPDPPEKDHAPRWLANGHAQIASSFYDTLVTWEGDHSVSFFQTDDDEYRVAVLLQKDSAPHRVRFAGESGEVVDLPMGQSSPVEFHAMNMNSYEYLPVWCSGMTLAFSVVWIGYAAIAKRLLLHGGWQVLLLILVWPVTFWSIEYLLADGVRSFLLLILSWLLLGVVSMLGAGGFVTRGRGVRGATISGAAIFAMIVLCEFANRGLGL